MPNLMSLLKDDASLPKVAGASPSPGNSPFGGCARQSSIKCLGFAPEKREVLHLQGIECICGNARDHECHREEHVCLGCGETFTAMSNGFDQPPSCAVHSGVVRKLNAGWYAWTCCLQRPHEASSVKEFKELNISHFGYHIC